MNKRILVLFTLVIFTLVTSFASHKAFAQFSSGVLVYPNVIELDFTNNKKFVSQVIQVENPTSEPFRIRAYVEGWDLNEYGGILFLDQPDKHSLNEYIKFNPKEFDVAPGQRQMIRLTAKLPEGVDGEFRSIIFFETVNQKQEILKQSKGKINLNVSFKTRYGVAVYAYKGNVTRNAALQDLKYEKVENKNYLVATLKNDGNIHCNVEGELVLNSKTGSEPITTPIARYTILPGAQKYKIPLPENYLNNGNYTALLKLKYKTEEEKINFIEAKTSFDYKATHSATKQELRQKNVSGEIQKTPDNVAVPTTKDGKLIPVDFDTEIKLND
ncbi:MAG: hypothetical protein ACD_20C00090G0010 [uncultured bacterium]|nr:MAG: hypothetical protein ACD_20C00090G0010 [uncultured bacterium]HBH18551.1 hypothetical protein [Cyanobacteria bacterium UBA9579]